MGTFEDELTHERLKSLEAKVDLVIALLKTQPVEPLTSTDTSTYDCSCPRTNYTCMNSACPRRLRVTS